MPKTLTLREDLFCGRSFYTAGTEVSGVLIHAGTRDECYAVTFPNGETSYLAPRLVR